MAQGRTSISRKPRHLVRAVTGQPITTIPGIVASTLLKNVVSKLQDTIASYRRKLAAGAVHEAVKFKKRVTTFGAGGNLMMYNITARYL